MRGRGGRVGPVGGGAGVGSDKIGRFFCLGSKIDLILHFKTKKNIDEKIFHFCFGANRRQHSTFC